MSSCGFKKPHDCDLEIRENLQPFDLYRQDSTDKYSSLAVCSRNTVKINNYHYFRALNALKLTIHTNFTKHKISLILLYRNHRKLMQQFINNIITIVNQHPVDIILGDFNINYFNDNEMNSLANVMNSLNYKLIVQKSTFISTGSLLDHVYVNPTLFPIVQTCIISVYYSDHDAVMVSINFTE